jgi:hypothetical protein
VHGGPFANFWPTQQKNIEFKMIFIIVNDFQIRKLIFSTNQWSYRTNIWVHICLLMSHEKMYLLFISWGICIRNLPLAFLLAILLFNHSTNQWPFMSHEEMHGESSIGRPI